MLKLASDRSMAEILAGSTYALGARLAAVALALASTSIVARVYGVEAVGTLAVVNSFLVLVTTFTVLGTSTSILRLIPEHVALHSVSSAFRLYRRTQHLVLAVSLVAGIAFFLASGLIADKMFSKPQLSRYFALAACFVVFKSLMELNTQAVRGFRLVRTYALMQIMPSLAMFAVLVAGTWFFRSPGMPVYAQLSAFAVTAVAGVLVVNRAGKAGMRAGDAVKPLPVGELVSISLPMLMTASIQLFIGQTGLVMLGMFRTESEVGYYAIAVKLATLTSFVLQAINSMAAPRFSELYSTGKMDELFSVARKSTRLIFWTTVPILLVLVSAGKLILGVLFGTVFIAAYVPMVLLVAGQFVNSVSGSTGYFLNMTGDQKIFRSIIFFSAVINVGLNVALIPRYGVNGAAFAGMVSLSYWNLHALLYIRKKYGRTIGYVPGMNTGNVFRRMRIRARKQNSPGRVRDVAEACAVELYKRRPARVAARRLFRRRTPDTWVFVVGCYNSGTTILKNMIAAHPRIGSLPCEGVFLTSVLKAPEEYGWSRMWIRCLQKIQLPDELQPDLSAELIADWSPWWRKDASVFLDKSVSNVVRMPWLQRNLGNCRFIGIVRNGYCAAEGIRRQTLARGALPGEFSQGYPIRMAGEQWVAANRVMLEDAKKIDSFKLISYEELVANPKDVLAGVWDFVGVSLPPLQTAAGALRINGTSFSLRDMNRESLQRLSPTDIGELREVIGEMQARFGYPL